MVSREPVERSSHDTCRSLWRFIDSGPADGPWNLALDDAIFQSVRTGASPPTLRVYAWSAPVLSIGWAQDRDRDVDLEACRARGVAVVRRATGGRAVLHDREVTYSVAVPAGTPRFGTGLDPAYRAVAAGLLAGLRLLGLAAALPAPVAGGRSRSGRSPGCFAGAARHEIEVGGYKLVGSAQRREGGAFLQQGSILIESHDAQLRELLRLPASPESALRMTGLADWLRPCPGHSAIAAALARGCARTWEIEISAGAPTVVETDRARELAAVRYLCEGWNAGRTPRGPVKLPA